MTRLMYDGINSDAALIPTSAQLVAGYVDGLYAWSAADWARFPNSVHVEIAVSSSTNAGIVLDVETGDATPAESVGWVLTRRAEGADPSVYCNTSTWPQVRSAFQARGVAEPHYWVALYDGVVQIPSGAVAKQYENTANWDLSVVADYWPGVDPTPTAGSLEDDMSSTTSVNGRAGMSWPAGTRHVVQVTYDPAGGEPSLRVLLTLTSGPWVAPNAMTFPKGSGNGVYEIPSQYVGACRGVILEGAPDVIYDTCAV